MRETCLGSNAMRFSAAVDQLPRRYRPQHVIVIEVLGCPAVHEPDFRAATFRDDFMADVANTRVHQSRLLQNRRPRGIETSRGESDFHKWLFSSALNPAMME